MESNWKWFKTGIQNGFPIFLGYLCVSFTLGIAAKNAGLTALQATVMSLLNNASAGEFAGIGVIAAGASYLEMAATELVVNLRYILMSCSISQKIDGSFSFLHRFAIAFGVTDEIFALSVSVDGKLNPYYSYGLAAIAIPGWAIGTCLGVISGNIMPPRVISAMSVALYGMFIAIIIPPAKKSRIIAGLVSVSMALSALLTYLPAFSSISSGFRIIILTLLISGAAAVLFPVRDEKSADEETEGEND